MTPSDKARVSAALRRAAPPRDVAAELVDVLLDATDAVDAADLAAVLAALATSFHVPDARLRAIAAALADAAVPEPAAIRRLREAVAAVGAPPDDVSALAAELAGLRAARAELALALATHDKEPAS